MVFKRSIKLILLVISVLILSYCFTIVRLCRYEKVNFVDKEIELSFSEASKHWSRVDTSKYSYFMKYKIKNTAHMDGVYTKVIRDTFSRKPFGRQRSKE
jgi:hypothetical protein